MISKKRLSGSPPRGPSLVRVPTPRAQLRELLRGAEAHDRQDAEHAVWELVGRWGREATLEALHAERMAAGASELPLVVTMIQLFGEDPELPPLPPAMRQGVVQAARELADDLDDGDLGAWDLAVRILEMPIPMRSAVWEGIRQQALAHPHVKTLASMLLLFPIDDGLRQMLEHWVVNEGGEEGGDLLELLLRTETVQVQQVRLRQHLMGLRNRRRSASASALFAIPLRWEVVEARLGSDPEGGERIVVARRRPDGLIALFIARLNDERLVEADGHPGMPEEAYRERLASWERDGSLDLVRSAEALARVEAGIAATRKAGYPDPFGFQVSRYLLAGV